MDNRDSNNEYFDEPSTKKDRVLGVGTNREKVSKVKLNGLIINAMVDVLLSLHTLPSTIIPG